MCPRNTAHKRYDKQADHGRAERRALFEELRGLLPVDVRFKLDGHEHYYDELFSVNHTFATLRAKVDRLNRPTWSTTQKPALLSDHLGYFIDVF